MNTSTESHIATLHHPECVVEVYINEERNRITEVKQLNGNRTKHYHYELEAYLDCVNNFKDVDTMIREFLAEEAAH
ncbi:MAG: hypothetical protein AAGB22_00130 [Bacteroidota bacterium]